LAVSRRRRLRRDTDAALTSANPAMMRPNPDSASSVVFKPVNGNDPDAGAARTVMPADKTRGDPSGALPSATRVCEPDNEAGIVTESVKPPLASAVTASR
jgi:hypothetical protein